MESIRKSVDKEFVKKAKILEPILDELELEKDLITDMVDHVLSKLHSRDNKYDYTDYEMAQIGNNGGVKQVDLISDVPMEGSRDTQYDLTDVPDEFICPITLDIMNDPVNCYDKFGAVIDGHAYERSAIRRWLVTKSKTTSPVTREPMDYSNCKTDEDLKRRIQRYKEKIKTLSVFPPNDVAGSTNAQSTEIPKRYTDIFYQGAEYMEDPVRCTDAGGYVHTYDRKNIENWLKEKKVSPNNNQYLEMKDCHSDSALKLEIKAYRVRNGASH